MARPKVRRLRGEIAPGVTLRRTLRCHVERGSTTGCFILSTNGRYPQCHYGAGDTEAEARADFAGSLTSALDFYRAYGRDRLSSHLWQDCCWLRRNVILSAPAATL